MRLFCCQAHSSAIVPSTIPSSSIVADSTTSTGLKWAAPAGGGGGKVLQVVQGTTTTSTYIATTSFTDTSLSATITPSASSSKILAIISQYCRIEDNTALAKVGYQLLRDSTAVYTIDGGGNQAGLFITAQNAPSIEMRAVLNGTYLDSPSTTSAITYKTQGNTADNVYFQHNSTISTLTLLEIGA